jgi:ligand-binding SRPBCC domain-containing protein
MVELAINTKIAASPETCFDLARSMTFHAESLADTHERIMDGPEHDLLEAGDEVEFEARHFGMHVRHRARIQSLDYPRQFRDVMVRGLFRSFVHDHVFETTEAGTLMRDNIRLIAPGGLFGRLAERVVLKPYLTRLLTARAEAIKRAAAKAPSESADRGLK